MNEVIEIINSWIHYAQKKAPKKLAGFFLLLDYAENDFTEEFYKKHFIEMNNILIELDHTKEDVKKVSNYMRTNHYEG